MLNISIPEPCHENWNEMTPTEKGAFCAVCSKEVMDFSNMSDEAVKHYLIQNVGKKTCGRFRKEQLGLNIVVDEQVIYTSIALWKKFLAVVVICFGAFFSSCTDVKGKAVPDGGTEVMMRQTKTDTLPGTQHMLGGIGMAEDTFPAPPMPNDLNVKIKVIDVTCECIQGDIAPPPVEYYVPEQVAIAPTPEPMPMDTLKKVVDTCINPKFL